MIPCNCTTTCMTVKAKDVLVGDYLDTRGTTSAAGFIARVFTEPQSVSPDGLAVVLNVEGQRAPRYNKTAKVKVWRDSRMAAKLGLACCNCATYVPPCQQRVLSCNAGVVQSMRAEADSLRETITDQQAEINRLGDKLAGTQLRANVAERKLAAIKAQF